MLIFLVFIASIFVIDKINYYETTTTYYVLHTHTHIQKLKGHFICPGFVSPVEIGFWKEGAEEPNRTAGSVWTLSCGVNICSSFAQYFDYLNDPFGLVDCKGAALEANVEVRALSQTYKVNIKTHIALISFYLLIARRNEWRIFIRSLRPILVGEELLCDYGYTK